MKILNVISDSNIGGAGKALLAYLKYRDADNFDVSVALPKNAALTNELRALNVQIYEVDIAPDKSFDLSSISVLKQLIREIRPDLVHTHGSLSARIAAKQCGCKVVFTRHTAFPPNPRYTHGFFKFVFKTINQRFSDRIIAVSQVCRDDLIQCGVDSSHIEVVLNGCEPLQKGSDEQRSILRKRFNIPENAIALGAVARLEPYKGHIYMLEALDMLKKSGYNAFLVIAGTGTCENELRLKANELGLTDSINFAGFVSDTEALYNALDIQINASYLEATSMSLIEGMSLGLPAVVSRCGGNPYVIKDGVSGLIFEERDSDGLNHAVSALIDDKSLYKKLSDGAVLEYSSRFTGPVYSKAVENVYLSLREAQNVQ